MKTTKINRRQMLLSLTLCLSLFSMSSAFAAPAKPVVVKAADTDAAALSVSLAAPKGEDGQRRINLSTADPYFDVVIRNNSNRPQRIWAEDNSNGYGNLTVKLLAIDGKPLVPPVVVSRPSQMVWLANSLTRETLEPGEPLVREVHFSTKGSAFYRYENFPPMKAGAAHKIRMRAIFTSPASLNNRELPVWTGRIVSAIDECQVAQVYR